MDQSKRTKSDNKLLRKKIQNRKNSISRIFVGQSAGPKKIKIVDLRSQFSIIYYAITFFFKLYPALLTGTLGGKSAIIVPRSIISNYPS